MEHDTLDADAVRHDDSAGSVESLPRHLHDEARTTSDLLPIRLHVGYGVGNACDAIKMFAFGLFLLFYYTSVRGLPATWVGVATALGLAWDSAIDPLIGHLSDRSRSRLGRRHGLMLAGGLGIGASFFAIFSPPATLTGVALFVWLLVTSASLRTSHSLFMVPYYALGAELGQGYEARTKVSAFRAGGGLAGTLLAAAASFGLFFPGGEAGGSQFDASGYTAMGLGFGVAMTALALVTIGSTWSRRTSATRDEARRDELAGDGARRRFFASFASALRHGPFRTLVASAALFFLATVINASLAVHYLTYYAEIPSSGAFGLFFLAFYLGALAGVPCWVWASRRIDKHRVYCVAMIITGLIMTAAYWIVGHGTLLGTGHVVTLAWGNGLAGVFASALWVILPSMIADVAEDDELTSGRRREGLFFGVYSFTQQAAAGIAVFVTGVLVDQFTGLIPGQVTQSAVTVDRLGILFGPLPGLMLIGAALMILPYRLTRDRVAYVKRQLASRTL